MEHRFTNHLIHEKSPYLLSHAHNPVDWYPWCPEAFAKARQENKPVFLSIGYSTCHWCHVMERESFENEEAAALLNRHFISIKTDREERPDIDSVYMSVCQAVNGSGGWPLTIIMTPDQQPFFAATYLPRQSRGQTPGLMQVLTQIAAQWEENPEKLLKAGASVADFLNRQSQSEENGKDDGAWPDKQLLHQAVSVFLRTFDEEYGGFGQAPKFPAPHNLLFLLRYARLEQNQTVEYTAAQTLFSMMKGGIFDHIGGGFSRYSTDRYWLIPHFEKMLYDNALLALAYLECWEQTGADWCLWTAERIFTYVFRELTDERGGFYCGQDADSEGVEGKYYGFQPEEVKKALGQRQGAAVCQRYDITKKGNFEGSSIPNLLELKTPWIPDAQTAQSLETLYRYRLGRYPLHKDDKILTSWNSLMAAACAKGARAALRLPEGRTDSTAQNGLFHQCLSKARDSLAFIRQNLTGEDGRLMVRWRDGQAAHSGHLDDYAFYAWALLELYETTFDIALLEEAVRIARLMVRFFFDTARGGFYLYASDAEALISRPKDTWDGAMPSGNSMAAMVLCQLSALTAQPEWTDLRDKQLAFLTREARQYPSGYSFALFSMTQVLYPSRELVCVLPWDVDADSPNQPGHPAYALFRRLAAQPSGAFHVLVKTPSKAQALARLAPFTASYPIGDAAAYYLCENGSCQLPSGELDEVLAGPDCFIPGPSAAPASSPSQPPEPAKPPR